MRIHITQIVRITQRLISIFLNMKLADLYVVHLVDHFIRSYQRICLS